MQRAGHDERVIPEAERVFRAGRHQRNLVVKASLRLRAESTRAQAAGADAEGDHIEARTARHRASPNRELDPSVLARPTADDRGIPAVFGARSLAVPRVTGTAAARNEPQGQKGGGNGCASTSHGSSPNGLPLTSA